MVWPLGLQKPSLSDRGVANGVTKFRKATGGLIFLNGILDPVNSTHRTLRENNAILRLSNSNNEGATDQHKNWLIPSEIKVNQRHLI